MDELAARRREDWWVFVCALVLNLVTVWYVVFRIELFQIDAMARTLRAWLVFFSSEPKLANMGFVWLPLPTLLQLPLVLIPPLRYRGISGNLLTAFTGAGAATVVNAIARELDIKSPGRQLFVAAFALNPMIALYSANGMSEIIAAFFLLLSFYCYVRWRSRGQASCIINMGLICAGWFLTRYESLLFAAAYLAMILVAMLRERARYAKLEATALLYGTPVAAAVVLWLGVNFAIMGDPLYFASGPYSPGTETPTLLMGMAELLPLKTSLQSTWRLLVDTIGLVSPMFFPAAVLLSLATLRKRDLTALTIVLLPLAFLISVILNFRYGFPLTAVRYYILTIPLGLIATLAAAAELGPRRWLSAILALLCIVSIPSTMRAMQTEKEGIEDHYFVDALLGRAVSPPWSEDKAVAAYIRAHVQGRDVLIDPREESNVIFFTGEPALFALPSDSDFHKVLANPQESVLYILVPATKASETLNQVLHAYPELAFEDDLGWAKLEYQVGSHRLYRVWASPTALDTYEASQTLHPPTSTQSER